MCVRSKEPQDWESEDVENNVGKGENIQDPTFFSNDEKKVE